MSQPKFDTGSQPSPVHPLLGPATLRDRALETLRNRIVDCTLPPGMVIKDEDLATQLGVSKTPIREALVQLAAEGLVDMPSNKVKKVAPLVRSKLLEIHFIYQMLREAAYRTGIPRLSEAHLSEMKAALADQKRALGDCDWVNAVRQGRRFHEVIVEANGNTELYKLMRQYTHAVDRVSIMLRPASQRIANLNVNLGILDAIKARDVQTAMKRMRAQSTQLLALLEALPEHYEENGSRAA